MHKCQLGRKPHVNPCSIVVIITSLMVSACGTEEVEGPSVEAKTLVLTESLRIGDEAEGDTVLFGRIWDIAVDSRARILVSDRASHGFRVFTSDGSLIREVGREGEGPGEFVGSPFLYVGKQDSVYVYDGSNDRVTVFSPGDYVLANTIRLREEDVSNARPTDVLAVLPDKLVVEYLHTSSREYEDGTYGMLEFKLVDRSGRIVRDSLVVISSMEVTAIDDEGFIMGFPRLFGRRPLLAMGSDGLIYYGWNDNISITAVASDGSVANEFAIPHVSVPVTPEEKSARAAGYPENWQEEFRQDMPDTKPAFNSMVPDDQGQLWLRLSWPEGASETEWIVVNAESGIVAAKTTLPIGVGLDAVRGGKAYGTSGDDNAVVAVWAIAE